MSILPTSFASESNALTLSPLSSPLPSAFPLLQVSSQPSLSLRIKMVVPPHRVVLFLRRMRELDNHQHVYSTLYSVPRFKIPS